MRQNLRQYMSKIVLADDERDKQEREDEESVQVVHEAEPVPIGKILSSNEPVELVETVPMTVAVVEVKLAELTVKD